MDSYKRKAGELVQAQQLMEEQVVETEYGPQTCAAGEWKVDEGNGRIVVYSDPDFEAAFEPVTAPPAESTTPGAERAPRRTVERPGERPQPSPPEPPEGPAYKGRR